VKTEKERKASFKEKEEFKTLEIEIENLENEKTELEISFSSNNLSPEKITEAHIRYNLIENNLPEKLERWGELAELME